MSFHEDMLEKYGQYEGFDYTERVKINKQSLVCNMGINDLEFKAVYVNVIGNSIRHPMYVAWWSMLNRCSKGISDKYPTYLGVHCSDDFKSCSNFAKWGKDKYQQNYVLDKDLLLRGNKLYSRDTSLFIPQEVNKFLITRTLHRSNSGLLGVSWHTRDLVFNSNISINGKQTSLGYFADKLDAHRSWQQAKLNQARVLKDRYQLEELQFVINRLQYDISNNLVTEII